ncbi:putative meiosis specific protein Hop1 [Aspergillus ibericus CBS 121593]|uniref:Meiosis specific protein Hop1 n=1 Tax=Aspergillus ibericus CBS 121593 TaxID=1448316 RepID=A0A395H825_9EURO|nr:meiosis specific protein Hop1 [Aspergillus ibericus CBS 121593]RAL03820.1 meiosis specific protein Hop1 [Aspergillus ibericus CBS 121593]
MVRVKFTGPPSTVQVQAPQNLHPLASNNRPVTRVRAPDVVEVPPRLTLQESIHLKQQQSLEMVQTMLHVSFGTLFYLREFLPLPCFDDRDLREAQRESRLSYRQFIDKQAHGEVLARMTDVPFGKGKKGQPLKIILRGSDPKADMILDILETGIFDALSRNVLEAVQLTILVDKNAPENVLESYTFSFKYTGEAGDVNSRLDSLSIEPVGCVADMKSAQAARIGLETIVRRLITLSAFLPTLPNKRNLGVHLFYTDDCPPDYDPPGFNGAANDDMIKFPLNENWKRESQSCGQMDSGWHTVGLKVTSLKWTGPEPEGSEAPPQIPPDLEYNDPVQRLEDIGLENKEDIMRTLGRRNSTSTENRSRPDDNLPLSPQRTNDNVVSTQDLIEKHQLQMMLPSQATGGSDSDLAPTQPLKPSVTLEDGNASLTKSRKFVLTEESRNRMQEYLRSQDLDASKKVEDQSAIRCQCGWEGEEAAMVECAFCHTRQHLLCYGYEDALDQQVPEVHACYQCLLRPDESQLLHEMNSLVLLRRAVRIILDEGYPSRTSLFMQKLHCNGQTIVQITDILRKRKLLLPTPGSKAKGFMRKGLPKFIIPSSEAIQQRLQSEILSPMIKIQHHYAQDSLQNSLQLSQSVNGDELDSIAKSLSQEESGSETQDEKKTHDPTEEPTEVLEESQSRKRKASLTNEHSQPNAAKDVAQKNEPTPRRSSDRILRKDSKNQGQSPIRVAKGKNTHQQTPTRRNSSESSLRRSSRKRRKISNYSKLVDVGADNSGNDSS